MRIQTAGPKSEKEKFKRIAKSMLVSRPSIKQTLLPRGGDMGKEAERRIRESQRGVETFSSIKKKPGGVVGWGIRRKRCTTGGVYHTDMFQINKEGGKSIAGTATGPTAEASGNGGGTDKGKERGQGNEDPRGLAGPKRTCEMVISGKHD